MIRVLLVDDHAVVIEGLTMLLSSYDDLEIAGAANSGLEGVRRYVDVRPDVVLMDVSMPDIDGLEATRRIRAEHAEARVIVLTGSADAHLVPLSLNVGVSGYLMKNTGGDELVEAVRRVASGQAVFGSEAMQALHTGSENAAPGSQLTPRETEVLRYIVGGLSNKQIATELGISSGTVRIHVSNVLAKLQVSNRTAAALYAVDNDLV